MDVSGHVTEFRRWRDASCDQKQQIAHEQALSLVEGVSHLAYQAQRDRLLEVITDKGKIVGYCTYDDLEAITEWSAALSAAMFEIANGRPAHTMDELERGSARRVFDQGDFVPGFDE
jgi:hypothetical protein